MRVLSGPSEGIHHPNPYIRTLLRRLDEEVELDVFRWRLFLLERYDVIHLHWPEHVIGSRAAWKRWAKLALVAVGLALARVRRTRLVWTVHNDRPHERGDLAARAAVELCRRCVDGAVYLTAAGREQAIAEHGPRGPSIVMRHGHFGPTLPERRDERPGPPRRLPYVVSFGLLRPYKCLDRLIGAAAELEDLEVVISGPAPDPVYLEQLRASAAATPAVVIDARYVPQVELVPLIRRSVGAVLPAERMYNSSSLILTLTLGRPALVADSPTNREIAGLVGPGWVHTFRDHLRAQDVQAFVATPPPPAPPDLRAFDWDAGIAELLDLYRRLAASAARG